MTKAGAQQRPRTPEEVGPEWADLLCLLPGYSPFAQAEGCWFDAGAAQLAMDFFPECLTHIEGRLANKPFVLERWQQSYVANLFGWKRLDARGDEVRRYRESFLMVPRKSGKSPMSAGIALYVLFCDDELGQQNYIAAGEREQAGKLFRYAQGMVRNEPELLDRCQIYGGKAEAGQSRSVVRAEVNSFLRVIAAEAPGEHGGTTHLAIIDELHVQPNRDLVDVLTTSFASENRKQPLFLNITTAGHDRESICYEKYRYACKVRDNGGDRLKPGYDPAFLPAIWETQPDEDWTSEEVWRKVNPNLGVSVSLDYLRRECQRAQETPDYENTFRQLHLNQWCEQATRWLSVAKWDACGQGVEDPWRWREEQLERLAGQSCFGGLDLASTIDLTAFVLLFPEDDGESITLIPWFWVPQKTIKQRRRADGVPYDTWARLGWISETEGDWCKYGDVRALILERDRLHAVEEVAFDPRECSETAQQLMEAGIKVVPFAQTFANYNEAVKKFEGMVSEGKVRHGNNPVLNWMAGNVALDRNIAGLRLPSKANSGDKIDGIVSVLMALARAMLQPWGSVYDSGGVFTV